jgi:hypothetical protein
MWMIDVVGEANLVAGWQEYTYSGKATADGSGRTGSSSAPVSKGKPSDHNYLDYGHSVNRTPRKAILRARTVIYQGNRPG